MTSNEYKTMAEQMNDTARIKRLKVLRNLLSEAQNEKKAIEEVLIEKHKAVEGKVTTMKGKGTTLELNWGKTITSVDVNKLKADGIYDDYTKQTYRKQWNIV